PLPAPPFPLDAPPVPEDPPAPAPPVPAFSLTEQAQTTSAVRPELAVRRKRLVEGRRRISSSFGQQPGSRRQAPVPGVCRGRPALVTKVAPARACAFFAS